MWTADKLGWADSTGYIRAYQGDELVWEKPRAGYVSFTSHGNSVIRYISSYGGWPTFQYSRNASDWENWGLDDEGIFLKPISVSNGQTLYVRGQNKSGFGEEGFRITGGTISLGGQITALMDYTKDVDTLTGPFWRMFMNNPITDVASDFLPSTTLCPNCYAYLFSYCSGLTKAPDLPAATLADACYDNMFSNCTSLNSVTCLATNIGGEGNTNLWLENVKSTGTFTKKAGVSWSRGDSGIPTGWTVVEQ